MSPTVTLTASNMGLNATEADYDLWVAYVAANIDAACGFEVRVSAATYGASQASDLIGDATDEQCETIREALIELWGEWCARGALPARETNVRIFRGDSTKQLRHDGTPADPELWYYEPADHAGDVLWSKGYGSRAEAYQASGLADDGGAS